MFFFLVWTWPLIILVFKFDYQAHVDRLVSVQMQVSRNSLRGVNVALGIWTVIEDTLKKGSAIICMHHCQSRKFCCLFKDLWKFSGHDLDFFRQTRVDFGGVNGKKQQDRLEVGSLDSFAFFTVLVFPWFGWNFKFQIIWLHFDPTGVGWIPPIFFYPDFWFELIWLICVGCYLQEKIHFMRTSVFLGMAGGVHTLPIKRAYGQGKWHAHRNFNWLLNVLQCWNPVDLILSVKQQPPQTMQSFEDVSCFSKRLDCPIKSEFHTLIKVMPVPTGVLFFDISNFVVGFIWLRLLWPSQCSMTKTFSLLYNAPKTFLFVSVCNTENDCRVV